MTLLNFVIGLLAALVLIVIVLGMMFAGQYIVWFHCRPCKHCNHTLEYKGLRENEDGGKYLFRCPECGN